MALTSVVTDPYFELVIAELRHQEQLHGTLAFAMLHRVLARPSRWSLTLAAPWIDATSRLKVTGEVIRSLRQRLGPYSSKLGSVLIRSTYDPVIQSLAPLMPVEQFGTTYEFKSLELSSFEIDEAYCLLSRPELLLKATAA